MGTVAGFAQLPIVTHHNDNRHTGGNLNETTLTTSNVNVNQFGKLFSRTVDGQIYGQPLYVGGVTIGGTVRNVIYVVTMMNNVYAFDADDPTTAAPLWQLNLGASVPGVEVSSFTDIVGPIGITSTPVIDPATGTLYLVAKVKESNSYFQRLHAIDITNGQAKFGGPVNISGSVPGTGDGAVGGVVAFNPMRHLNRPALVLSNGHIYIMFGSHEDTRPYHGWVFSYNATTLQRVGIYNDTPNGWGGGIWSSGTGPAVDENGNIYFMTANGTFTMNSGGQDCSSCFVKLGTPSLNVVDWFAPSNQSELNGNNYELNSSGPILIPNSTSLMGGGKEGVFYVIDYNNMGHFQAGGNPILQWPWMNYGQHLHGSPIYWNSPGRGPLLYLWYEQDFLKAFTITNGRLSTAIDPATGLLLPTMKSTMKVPDGMPGGVLSLSANGGTAGTGIIWATAPLSQNAHSQTVAGIFRAFDATNLPTELWNSQQNGARDGVGNFAKFTPPTIANGKVYIGTFSNQLLVYGLLGVQPAPTISSVTPTGGSTSGGAAITVRGTNFGSGATVSVGGTPATGVTFVNSTMLNAIAPAHAAGTVSVGVTNPDGQSASLSGAFSYTSAPTVDSVAPSAGPMAGGTLVTLRGINYEAGATVTIGGIAATGLTIVNATTITATTPAHAAGPVNVTVTNTDTQSGTITSGFTYLLPAPGVTGVSPASGLTTGGVAITITGSNVAAGATVSLGGTAATNVTVVNATTITATTPAHTPGAVAVVVANSDGQSGSLANGFTYTVTGPAPTIAIVTPGTGSTAGGTSLTIVGTNFAAGASVVVGGTAATAVTVVNSTTITATTPAHAAGAVSVIVTNADLQSATLANAFTYATPTAITFIQVASTTPQTARTSVALAYTSAQTPGDLNVIAVGWNETSSLVQSVQDSAGNQYLLAIGPTTGTGLRQSIYYAKNIVGGANTVTVTFNQAAAYVDLRILQYRGVNALDVVAGAAGAGATANSGNATTTGSNGLIFGASMVSSYTTAAGAGFTSRVITAIDGDQAEDKVVATPGVYNATSALGSGNWVMQMAAFKLLTGPAPTVTNVTPASGSTGGGSGITITGSNFAAGATVSVGGTAATGVTVVNSTTITATAPAHAAGGVGVTVTNADGQSATLASAFTYLAPAPTVTGVTPASGTTTGGTAVTVSGTGFTTGATVAFDGTSATGVTVVNGTTITATTPAHTAGAVNVSVTNTDGQSGTRTSGFTYLAPAPTVTGVAPASGPVAGGTSVTISGTNFVAGAAVSVGGTAATGITVVNATTITATTPAHAAGAVSVTVTNADGQSGTRASGFTYIAPAPTVTGVAPTNGPVAGGTAVTISGGNFVAGATVSIGGTAATGVTIVDSATITATTPAHAAGAVGVTVTNGDGQSGTQAGAFTYIAPAPTVTGVSPASGPIAGGTSVTVSGSGFAAGAAVTFDGVPASGVTVVNSTTITATTPAHAAGAVGATVTNADGQSGTRANAFTYLGPAPTVTGISPANGSRDGGTAVTITGANFAAGATVSVGGTGATGVAVVDSGTITATTPAHAVGVTGVTVTNADGQSGVVASAFTFLGPPPTVTGMAPGSGAVAGGTAVTITGTNFAAGATVSVGGTGATGVTVVNGTTITATTPAHAAGLVGVAVTNADAQNATLADAFNYVVPPPTVTGVSPSTGTIAGGTAVTVSGTGFAAGAAVTLDGIAASGVTVVNGTTITASSPAHVAGAVDVTVTNADGQSGVRASAFTYQAPAPVVTGVLPVSGPIAGGTAVTISGTNFVAGATVSVGGTAATAVTVVDATTITATTPAHAAGAVAVSVANPDGQNAALANAFTYLAPAPSITSVTPGTGAAGGGTALTIAGANFAAGAAVTVGGTTATGITVVNASTITATAPAHAVGSVNVTVTNADAQSATLTDGFVYTVPAPTVTGVAPTSGPIAGGTAVTISGTGFAAGATVKFDTSLATIVTVVNSTTITATTPAHAAGAVAVTVTNADGQSGVRASAFTYQAGVPTVTGVAPTSGPASGGTAITISGTNFVAGATATVGGTAATAVTVVNSTTITATTPAHAAGAVAVVVRNPDLQSGTRANAFTYLAAPTVTAVAPATGLPSGGTAITITGTNFRAGATVSVGGTAATSITVVNATTITATTPAHAAGAVSVAVTNTDGQTGTRANAFTYATPSSISFIQVAATTPQTPMTVVQLAYPAAQTAGDLNIVVVGWNDTSALVSSVVDTAGNVYKLAIGPTTGSGLRQSIYYANGIAGGANTVTVTFNQAASYADVRIVQYRGVSTLDVTAGANGNSATANSGAATTTAASELIFGAAMVSTYTTGAGSGFTSRIVTFIDGDLAEDRIVSAVGSYSATSGLSSGQWVMQMATFK